MLRNGAVAPGRRRRVVTRRKVGELAAMDCEGCLAPSPVLYLGGGGFRDKAGQWHAFSRLRLCPRCASKDARRIGAPTLGELAAQAEAAG